MPKLPATMAYRGGRARERILAFGPMGSGKSTAARTLFDILGAGDTLWVIDCDNRWDGIIDAHPELDCEQVQVLHARDWESFLAAFKKVKAQAARDDWTVIDSITWPWAWIQRWYVKKTHGEDMPDFLLDHRMKQIREGKLDAKTGADGGQSGMLIEWNYLNPLWLSEVAEPIVNWPSHLFLIAEGKTIRSDGRERKDIVDMFAEFEYKPETQWRVGFNARSVLLFTKTGRQQFRFNNGVKDDEREVGEYEWGEPGAPGDFGMEYLVKVAGWKPRKVEVDE